jgi:hypothetical protein
MEDPAAVSRRPAEDRRNASMRLLLERSAARYDNVSMRCAPRVKSGIGTPKGQAPAQGALHSAHASARTDSF